GLLRASVSADRRPQALGRAIREADLWTLLAVCHLLVCASIPFLFERYLVVVSPLLSGALVLDVVICWALLRLAPRGKRPVALPALAPSIAAALVASILLRLPDLQGRWDELVTPYRGPLDFAIEAIAGRYERPENLTIATNYESTVLMFYLGSRVLSYHGSVPEEGVAPDVVVPRNHVGTRFEALMANLRKARYEAVSLPVGDLPFNNSPEVSVGPGLTATHQFRRPRRSASSPLVLYFRAEP